MKRTKEEMKLIERKEKLLIEIKEISEKLSSGATLSLSQALSKTYNVNFARKGKGVIGGRISTPMCLLGRRVRLVLVEEKKNE